MSRHSTSLGASLRTNPFYTIGATTRDDKRKIVELAEEKSLLIDHDACEKARSDLTNPRTRLTAEVSWLPGISPKQAIQLIQSIESNCTYLDSDSYPDLAFANLYSFIIELLDAEAASEDWVVTILEFALAIDRIDACVVMRDINEDRAVSGFPEIVSLPLIEEEILNRRSFYKDVVKNSFDKLPTTKLVEVLTQVVDEATDSGESSAPVLVDELVDVYEIQAHSFLEKEFDNLQNLIESARSAADSGQTAVAQIVHKISHVLKNWDKFAQPIQLSMKSRGLEHSMSHKLAYGARSLAVDLCNEHGMVEIANQITNLLREVFAELPEVIDRLEDDKVALDDLLKEVRNSQQKQASWEKEISFNAEIGLIMKDKLSISADGIRYNKQYFPLDSITQVRWGAVRHSLNGIPTGTTHSIFFGNKDSKVKIETRDGRLYNEFIGKFWKAVCVNLLVAMTDDLRNGTKYRFGDAVIDDFGAQLIRHKFLISNEQVYVKWNKIRKWSNDGCLYLGLDGEINKTYCSMSYKDINNVHILDAAIGILFDRGGDRLSSILNN
jgi:hypothetical protein